ncbi:MAG: hypothetical protein SWO11_06220 [Thermodesulfobacteriota bacterium]|nr:hypothetical protein [Thermodesulfobacteriota bacterium]
MIYFFPLRYGEVNSREETGYAMFSLIRLINETLCVAQRESTQYSELLTWIPV